MQIVTLLKTIPSGSHNAPFSEEHGQHWPAGQQFKVVPTSPRLLRFRPYLAGNFLVEQIGGEEVMVSVPLHQVFELFGVQIPNVRSVADVKRDLPPIMLKLGAGKTKTVEGRLSGRLNSDCTVSITTRTGFVDWHYSWEAITRALNSGKPLVVDTFPAPSHF